MPKVLKNMVKFEFNFEFWYVSYPYKYTLPIH